MQGSHVLVTGGAGFIGAAVVRRFVELGARVSVFDDFSRGAPRRLDGVREHIKLIEGDVRDAAAVSAACAGVDVMCHLAFVNGTELFYKQPELVLEVGVKGIVNTLDGCKQHGVERFILASSSEVYQTPPLIPTPEDVPLVVPDPRNPRFSYGGGKIISELMAIHYGTWLKELFIFRPHNVFGPDMGEEHVIPQLARRILRLGAAQPTGPLRFPIQGTGDETRAFLYIADFVDGLTAMLGGAPGTYHIGHHVETSIRELIDLLGKVIGREVILEAGPLQPGSTLRRCPETSKLRALGFSPRVKLEHALRETVAWYSATQHPRGTHDSA